MIIKFFLIYAGVMFGAAMSLWLLVKKFAVEFSEKSNKTLIYALLSAILTGGVAFCATLLTDNLFILFWILAAIFLLSGALLTVRYHKKFGKNELEESGMKLFLGELLFTLSVALATLAVFSVLEYFLWDKNFMFYPVLLSALLFIIPLLLAATFDAAQEIPAAAFSIWQYPTGRTLDPPEEKEGERLLVIGFEIAKKRTDARKTYFRARAPERISLGELFYHFINDYNELQSETPIQFMDRADEAQQWWYRRKPKWYQGTRVLDPAKTVAENGILENTVIICERRPPEL
jgi:hypothetical protein